jgi:hypothetical protein
MTNEAITSEPGPVDPSTGVRRLDLWRESSAGGQWGDNARGDGYTSCYVSDDGHGCAEIAVYPVLEPWGWDVREQTTAGRAVRDDPDADPRPDDQAEITYDYPHPYVIDSEAEAQRIAERIGRQDYSYALNLRKQS